MRELLELIARGLVEHPEAVHVSEEARDDATVLALRVGADDLGKVIGKQGKTARAIRTILAASGRARKQRVVVEILD